MTDDLVKRLRALDIMEAYEAADMIERLNRENDKLCADLVSVMRHSTQDSICHAKALAEQKREQRLIVFGGAVLGASLYGGIVLLGTWLHGDLYMGFALLFIFGIVTLLGDLIIRAFRWASSWWRNRNDR